MSDKRSAELRKKEKMETTLPQLIDRFITDKKVEGKSEATLRWYHHMLTKYSEYLGGGTIGDVNLTKAREFVDHLQNRETRYANHPVSPLKQGGLKATSIQGYVRTLKVFASWLNDEGLTKGNVLVKLKRPKVPETVVQILSDEELEQIFDCVNPNCMLGNRMFTILQVLLGTGIRASELCGLTVENVNLEEDYIKVLGKGNKERLVPLGNNAKKALARYISHWRPESDCEYVFLDLYGKPLSYNNLIHGFSHLGKKAGVPRLHPHLCRHFFAVRYLMEGHDLYTLKRILGHTEISTTEMYLKLTDAQVLVQGKRSNYMDRFDFKKKRV